MDGKKNNERLLWIALALVIASSVIGLVPDPTIKIATWVMGGVGFGLFIRDFLQLRKQGAIRPGWYWLFFLPGYLWKRGRQHEQGERFMWAAGGMLVLCILMLPLSAWIAQEAMLSSFEHPPALAQQSAPSSEMSQAQPSPTPRQDETPESMGLESMVASHLSPPDDAMRRGEWVIIGNIMNEAETTFRVVTDDAMESGTRFSPSYMVLDYSHHSDVPSISILTPVLSSVEEVMESYGWAIFDMLVDGKKVGRIDLRGKPSENGVFILLEYWECPLIETAYAAMKAGRQISFVPDGENAPEFSFDLAGLPAVDQESSRNR